VDGKEGAQSLRELLRLYVNTDNVADDRQVEGVRSIHSSAIVRRLPVAGPISYARGLQITVTLEDSAFEGSSAFIFGAVLEQFFAQYVSLNSFTETVVKTTRRGDIMRWPARMGLCEIL
jgi:type VI secretion system protein ImpG